MPMPIKIVDLCHTYNEGTPHESIALIDVSLEINDGEFVSIIGHTGSGKSTLAQHLNEILKPKSGDIFIGDKQITAKGVKLSDIRKKIGLLFQYPEYQLFDETLYKDISFGPQNLGLSKEETDERVRSAMSMVGLDFDELSERSPFDLSGGQKRKAAIAGVLAMKPQVLILDEPTAGLDPKSHKEILNMMLNLRNERSITLILITHNMSDVAEISDRIFVMEKGRITLSGTPEAVFSQKDYLQENGLGLPPITEFVETLKKRGANIQGVPLTIETAVDLIDVYLLDREKTIV
jgi:energy-coupling factor transport system ATP-binding protein